MAEIGSVIGEKYEIQKQIGTGGMSVVYLAWDLRISKPWAVKEIRKCGNGEHEEIIENSLLTEADIMKRLNHPALPRIVDITEDLENIYLVMDYIEGRSLDRVLKERGVLPEKLVLNWAVQICDALNYLHSRKPPIIYRDMKPANIMLDSEGQIKIIDFGIAREYKAKGLTDTTVLGTRGYASPEHYGSRQTDARSDIYTLGMTLHHLLTGVSPRTPGYVYRPVRYWNPQLSVGVEAVIDRCTALDPDKRYPNCEELLYDLEHIGNLTADHRKRQSRCLKIFFTTAVLSAALFTTGFSLKGEETRIRRDRYDTLVSVIPSLSLEEKLKNYAQAVEIRPDDTTAYLCMIEAIEEEGIFDQTISDAFLSLYNANRNALDEAGAEGAELNYRIGILYFTCYTDGEEDGSFSTRLQKAYPFFAANHENGEQDYADSVLSECYYQICSFYRTYILGPVGKEEPSKGSYLDLIAAMDGSIDLVLDMSAYDQLTLYNSVFLLLYDQRENMAAVRVDRERVLRLFDRVRARTVVLSVQKEQSTLLRDEILEHYSEYRDAIERAYDNAEENMYG
ncbi:MAG: serine/threonine protein kinase [Lachnospiraceae bacterium]|nr:serine/threonine protein kinase [Lachnospiraceae bacterium]